MQGVDGTDETTTTDAPSRGFPQCRICFDGPDQELGRLIRPCLCKGSISVGLTQTIIDITSHLLPFLPQHVHVKCLQKWRTTSASREAFWVCPQCHYRYHFARTRVSGLATNPGKFPSNLRAPDLSSLRPWSSGCGCLVSGHIHTYCLCLFHRYHCLSRPVPARGLRGLLHLLVLFLSD